MKWLRSVAAKAVGTVGMTLTCAALLGSSGCVKNDITLTVNHFVEPDSTCVVDTMSTLGIAGGILDVGLVQDGFPGYVAYPLIENNLPETIAPGESELNAITVTGVNVKLQGNNINFSQPSFFIEAAGGRVTPAGGLVVFGAEILPRSVALQLAKTTPLSTPTTVNPVIDVQVSAVGTRSGDTLVSAPLGFPVEICNHCLTGTIAACPTGGVPTSQFNAGGCNPGQDVAVTCCTNNSSLLCGSQVPVNSSTGTDM